MFAYPLIGIRNQDNGVYVSICIYIPPKNTSFTYTLLAPLWYTGLALKDCFIIHPRSSSWVPPFVNRIVHCLRGRIV